MKKVLILLSTAIVLFTASCKKTGVQNPLADVENLSVGSYLTLVQNVNLNLSYNVPTSLVSIKVDNYGADVDKINLYVVKGANSSPAVWKLIKTVSYAGAGTVLSATSQEVATALAVTVADLTPGNFYTFYNEVITKDGRKFNISNGGNALVSNSNYNASFQWQAYVTCPFSGPIAGNYKVMQDDWADWSAGDIVAVTDGPGANQVNLSAVWPNPAYGDISSPLIVNVNPADGTAKVPSTPFGVNYPGTAVAVGANEGDVAGYVFSCTGFITLTMKVTYNGSSQGNLKLVLQKQ
jgi:hypothetical protein